VVLMGASHYRFNGKDVDCRAQLHKLPSLRHTIVVDDPDQADGAPSDRQLPDLTTLVNETAEPAYTPVPFDLPLWILFSSGTTGKLKHGHGGMTLKAVKFYALNHDVGSGDVYYMAPTHRGWCGTPWPTTNVRHLGRLTDRPAIARSMERIQCTSPPPS
jgi:acetoacetyl-CoA synthetase